MMKKRIAALAIGASLATSAVLAPQADARDRDRDRDRHDRPAILKLSSFKKDDKKKGDHKKGDKSSLKRGGDRDKDKDKNKKSSYNLKGFHASSKKDDDKKRPGHGHRR